MNKDKNNERWRDWNSQEIIHSKSGERTLCNRVIFNNIKTGDYPTCLQCLKKLNKQKDEVR